MGTHHPSRTNARRWRAVRQQALDRDHHRCTAPGCRAPAADVDHVVPVSRGGTDALSRGGTDALSNLASICRQHHAAKTAAQRPRQPRPQEPHPGLL